MYTQSLPITWICLELTSTEFCTLLQSLGPLAHNVAQLTKDFQIGATPQNLLVFVTGQLRIGNDNPLHFSQMFQLVAVGPGQYYVHNDVFRLIYG
jgi:hypothetical protein